MNILKQNCWVFILISSSTQQIKHATIKDTSFMLSIAAKSLSRAYK